MDITTFLKNAHIEHWRRDGSSLPGVHHGLKFKLTFLIVIVSLVSVLLSAFLLYNFQRSQLIENAEYATAALSNTIEANFRHAMVVKDWIMVEEILKDVTAERVVDAVRILNSEGRVAMSSIPGEAGMYIDRTDTACISCHSDSPVFYQRTTIATHSGSPIIVDVNKIDNQQECILCHGLEKPFLGMILVDSPITPINDQINRSFWRSSLLAFIAFSLIIGLLIPALNRTVITPITELSKGVKEIGAGNLDYIVPVNNKDEMGELALSFNLMRSQLKESHLDMAQRQRELVILNEVAAAATNMLDLDQNVKTVLETIVKKLDFSAGLIYLIDEIEGVCTLKASIGIKESLADQLKHCPGICNCNFERNLRRENDVFIKDLNHDERFACIGDCANKYSLVELPLLSKGKDLGAIVLITTIEKPVSERGVEYLKLVAREVGIAIDNALLLKDTRRREQEAITLYELGTKISASLDIKDVLDAVAEAARELLSTDIGVVGLVNEDKNEVFMEAVSGTPLEGLDNFRQPVIDKISTSLFKNGQTIIAEKYDPEKPILHDEDLFTEGHIASYLAAPLILGEKFLGFIEVMTHKKRRFLQRDAHLLLRLAHHVIVTIENAQLYHQLRYLASLEERDRLAREMHDRLAQTLGYMNIKASISIDLLSEGNNQKAQESLLELKKVAKSVYTDVRESIFNLRTTIPLEQGFIPSLFDYVSEYRARYGVNVHLAFNEEDHFELHPEVATQLLRIIQESLTNVRKHAEASQVCIRFNDGADDIQVFIEDNGRGFDPNEILSGIRESYGLKIMRERAESFNGNLGIESMPGQGTRVIVKIPKSDNKRIIDASHSSC
jgi:nitrate/nitrite-specific signal transduction histidine kinase